MSLVKQILIALVATLALVVLGYGSYAASKQLFPDPTTATTTNGSVTPTVTSSVPTVSDYRVLEPKNHSVKKEGDFTLISFETAKPVGVTVYITPSKTDRVVQAMKDYQNGVPNVGKWIVATPDTDPIASHLTKVPNSSLSKTGETYYYILVSYKASWLPYGGVMDYVNGPTEPYIIK
jgi:hypothetical protein